MCTDGADCRGCDHISSDMQFVYLFIDTTLFQCSIHNSICSNALLMEYAVLTIKYA